MSVSSRKKVIVRKFTRDWQSGYVDPSGFAHDGQLELLDLTGKVLLLTLKDVKTVCFVREFLTTDPSNPERLLRRNFAARPRTPGLWLRLRFRDGDEIEGLASNDLSLLDPEGIQFAPPDLRSNTQRVFVPRTAIQSLEILAVIGSGTRRKTDVVEQERLFAS